MLSNQIHPTEKQIAQLKSYPENTPVTMLNILKFKVTIIYKINTAKKQA